MSKLLQNSTSVIIAEHKLKSPSKQTINSSFTVEEVEKGYQNLGLCRISVLTDMKYFGESLEDLLLVRAAVTIPLLRKEFIIDEYQLLVAKAYGADVILLIAAVLIRQKIKYLSEFTPTFKQVTLYQKGEIIGSAFMKFLSNHPIDRICDFL